MFQKPVLLAKRFSKKHLNLLHRCLKVIKTPTTKRLSKSFKSSWPAEKNPLTQTLTSFSQAFAKKVPKSWLRPNKRRNILRVMRDFTSRQRKNRRDMTSKKRPKCDREGRDLRLLAQSIDVTNRTHKIKICLQESNNNRWTLNLPNSGTGKKLSCKRKMRIS